MSKMFTVILTGIPLIIGTGYFEYEYFCVAGFYSVNISNLLTTSLFLSVDYLLSCLGVRSFYHVRNYFFLLPV